MVNTIYVLEDVNLICGDTSVEATPGISTHLTISELKLPGMEEAYVDHMPGGAAVSIEVPMHYNRLESTFNLAGFAPEVMVMLGRPERVFQRFTAYGLVKDRRTGASLQAMAIMEGRLGRVNPQAFRKSDLLHHEFSIRAITHYELYMAPAPETEPALIWFWDFFTSKLVVGGQIGGGGPVDLNAERVRILRIPGVSG